MYWIQTSFSYI